jgi:hypothetical protein
MIVFTDYKSYNLTCEKCEITEEMKFIQRCGFGGYRYWDTSEVEPFFKPRCGFFNDSPPVKCPLCGSRLKRTPGSHIEF